MFNRILGPVWSILTSKTGAQAKASLVAAQGADVQLMVVAIIGRVKTAEANKWLYLWDEANTTTPAAAISLTTATHFCQFFGEEGLPVTKNKALQWQSDATTGAVDFTVLYRIKPPGG